MNDNTYFECPFCHEKQSRVEHDHHIEYTGGRRFYACCYNPRCNADGPLCRTPQAARAEFERLCALQPQAGEVE